MVGFCVYHLIRTVIIFHTQQIDDIWLGSFHINMAHIPFCSDYSK